MSIWEILSWANVIILGVGAPIVLVFFLRDLGALLAYLDSGAAAAPPFEVAPVDAEPLSLDACQGGRPPL